MKRQIVPLIIGLSLVVSTATPVLAATTERGMFTDAVALAIGGANVVVKQDGTMWAWGANKNGELGIGSTYEQPWPVLVPNMTDVQQVSASDQFILALKKDGTVYGAGNSGVGMFADGTRPFDEKHSFVPIPGLTNVTQISSTFTNLALKSDGTVWEWGMKDSGGNSLPASVATLSQAPIQVEGLTDIVAIAGGYENLALKKDGTVWEWMNGNQTHPENVIHPTVATQVAGLSDVKQIVGMDYPRGTVLKNDGTIWQWSESRDYPGPTPPAAVDGYSGIASIAETNGNLYGLKADGTVWGTGWDLNGELGIPTKTVTTPIQLANLQHVTSMVAAGSRAMLIEQDGSVWGVGPFYGNAFTATTTYGNVQPPFQLLEGNTTPYIDGEKYDVGRELTVVMNDTYQTGASVSITGAYMMNRVGYANSDLTITVHSKNSDTPLFTQTLKTDGNGNYSITLPSENWDAGSYVVRTAVASDNFYSEREFQLNKGDGQVNNGLTDIEGNWAKDAILTLYKQGVISGYPDNTFHPNDPVTRAQMAKIYAAASGIVLRNDEDTILSSFHDDKFIQDWSRTSIAEMAQNNVMKGYANGNFSPNDPVTRQQMATILANGDVYASYANVDLSRFQDQHVIADWARKYVAYGLYSDGMQGSYENGAWYFRPEANLTRAEAASLMVRTFHMSDETAKLPKGSVVLPKSKLDAAWTGASGEGGNNAVLVGHEVITSDVDSSPSSVYAYDSATGKNLWHQQLPVASQVPLAGDTSALLVPDPSSMRDLGYVDSFNALDPQNGQTMWSQTGLGAPIRQFNVTDNQAYVLTTDALRVYDATKGTLLWKATISGGTTLAVKETSVLVGTNSGSVLSFTLDGKSSWTKTLLSQALTQVIPAGNTWIAVQGDAISSLTEGGIVNWTHHFANNLIDGEADADSNAVYAVATDGKLVVLDQQTGNLKQAVQLPFFSKSAPVVQDNTLYLVTTQGDLAVLNADQLSVREIVDTYHPYLNFDAQPLEWNQKPILDGTLVIGVHGHPRKSNDVEVVALQTMTPPANAPTTVTLPGDDPTSGELPYRTPWHNDTPAGFGADVVRAGNMAITVNATSDGSVIATDLNTGQEIWKYEQNDYYRGMVDASTSYVALTTGNQNTYNPTRDMTGVKVLDANSGKPLWQKSFDNTPSREQVIAMHVEDDKVVVVASHHLFVYNAKTGASVVAMPLLSGSLPGSASAAAFANGQVAVATIVDWYQATEPGAQPMYHTKVNVYNLQGQVVSSTMLPSGTRVSTMSGNNGVWTAVQDKTVTAVSNANKVLWSKTMSAPLVGNNVVIDGNNVYVVQTDAQVRMFGLGSGTQVRSNKLPYPLAALPAIVNGKLYASTNLGHLEVINGSTLWVESETSQYRVDSDQLSDLNWYTTPIVYESGVLGVVSIPNQSGGALLFLR